MTITRRRFCATALRAAAGATLAGVPACSDRPAGPNPGAARLRTRPHDPTGTIGPGLTALHEGGGRHGLLYVPTGYDPATPARMLVALQGAGGTTDGAMTFRQPLRRGARDHRPGR